MKYHEAIERLDDMQSQIIHESQAFKEIADVIREAAELIRLIKRPSLDHSLSEIERANAWLDEAD